MKYNRLNRRHFLQGVGATLTLPLLPSLMGRAEAQTLTAPRFFVASWVGHGGLSVENAYPLDGHVTLADAELYANSGGDGPHVAKWGRLVDLKRTHAAGDALRTQVMPDLDNGAARVSPLIGAFVEDALLEKMNVLRGIDFLTFGGHTRGFLGNFTNRDGGTDNGLANAPVPTIDAVIALSRKFQPESERLLQRAPVVNAAQTHLSTYPTSSGVANNPYEVRTLGEWFQLLFSGLNTTPGQTDPRVSLVDRVYADYVRLSRGAFGPGRRLGKEDRGRLEEYVAGVQNISDRMRATTTAGCVVPSLTAGQKALRLREGESDWDWDSAASMPQQRVADQRSVLELTNMMMVHAFLCGVTRVVVRSVSSLRDQWNPAVFNTASQFETQRTDAHGMLFHNHMLQDRQQLLLGSQRFFFEYGYVDLVRRMAQAQVLPGVSLLDQSMVYWSSESGPATHDAKSVPAIIAGGGGGYWQTGRYVDYTNRTRDITGRWGNHWRAGIPQNRLLANFARAMGLSPEDYELSDERYATKFPSRGGRVPGYGDPFIEPGDNRVPYPAQMVADMSEKLPLL